MTEDRGTEYPGDDPGDEPDRWDGYVGPRVWFPVGLLGLAAVAFLGIMLALNWGDADSPGNTPPANQPGEPGSTLRQGIHWHADFALHIRGEAFDFEQSDLVSTAERELSSAVHIHDPRHNVVHVHLSSSTWGEFFQSLGFRIGDDCVTLPGGEQLCNTEDERWTFLINGVQVDSIRFHYIGDLERLVLSYGPESAEDIVADWQSLVGDQACIPSAACSDRFPPGGIEEEPCAVGSTTCN